MEQRRFRNIFALDSRLVNVLQTHPMRRATTFAKPHEIQRQWHLINAEGQILGRLATRIAVLLRGKHKPSYTPHWDSGDHVIIINAAKVRLSGAKATTKRYTRYSGYPDGLKSQTFEQRMQHRPTDVVWDAVRGMLQKNTLGFAQIKKLHVYAGSAHPHQAQQPVSYPLNARN